MTFLTRPGRLGGFGLLLAGSGVTLTRSGDPVDRAAAIVWWQGGTGEAHEKEGDMATYVLVHGGGHGGWCYRRVAPLLRAEGHEVYTPTMTGLGERAHLLNDEVDLHRHIEDIAAVLEFEDVRDAILVGHSYGGMVITGTADKVAERIGRLVFLDAANPLNGQSLADVAGPVSLLILAGF